MVGILDLFFVREMHVPENIAHLPQSANVWPSANGPSARLDFGTAKVQSIPL